MNAVQEAEPVRVVAGADRGYVRHFLKGMLAIRMLKSKADGDKPSLKDAFFSLL